MNFELLGLPVVFLVSLTGIILLVSPDWRVSIAALAVQYIGVFVLVAMSWPLEMAIVKLVTGWMVCAVLALAKTGAPGRYIEEQSTIMNVIFRLLAAGLVGLVVASTAPRISVWVPEITIEQLLGGWVLIGLGLLHLGLTSSGLRVILGLLTVLAGFEIIYAAVETSVLVAGLLAAVSLGLALVGAYLLVIPSLVAAEEEIE
ncbi:MAG: hypothetical protein MUO67_21290 [Anaerolineales bacterium]|nr:hypothetical protein [Anaerolineales bacterium]